MALHLVSRETVDRFWSKVDRGDPGACWPWKAGKTSGYGHFSVGYRDILAHRFAYGLERGSIKRGLQLDHLCRNRACVNPAHLEPVTLAENIRRGETGKVTGARQRAKTHCPSGHPYDEANTYVTKDGRRDCRECVRRRSRESMRARRARGLR